MSDEATQDLGALPRAAFAKPLTLVNAAGELPLVTKLSVTLGLMKEVPRDRASQDVFLAGALMGAEITRIMLERAPLLTTSQAAPMQLAGLIAGSAFGVQVVHAQGVESDALSGALAKAYDEAVVRLRAAARAGATEPLAEAALRVTGAA